MIDFAQILSSVGEFGAFQKRLLVAVCLPNIFTAFHMFGQVFTAITFPHNCDSSWILQRAPNLTEEKQLNLTIPLDSKGQYESCTMFSPVDLDLDVIEAYGINTTTSCTDGWVYKAPEGSSTLITEVLNFIYWYTIIYGAFFFFFFNLLYKRFFFSSINIINFYG